MFGIKQGGEKKHKKPMLRWKQIQCGEGKNKKLDEQNFNMNNEESSDEYAQSHMWWSGWYPYPSHVYVVEKDDIMILTQQEDVC